MLLKMAEITQALAAASQLEDEDDAAFAVTFVVFWYYQQQQRTKKRVWEYQLPYEYVHHPFSLELMPPSRVRLWLQFTPVEIQQLVPLLGLESVVYHCQY